MKSTRSFKLITVLLLMVLAWVLIAPYLAERLIIEKPLARADAILVLSGSQAFEERTRKAAALYKQNIAPRVLLTDDGGRAGWSRVEQRNPSFAEAAREKLIEQGVPVENIEILEPQVTGTIYEADILRRVANERNYKAVLLVTSPYHTRRTLRTFEEVFAENKLETEIGIEHAPLELSSFAWWLSKRGWRDVAGEYVKSFYYRAYY